MEKDYKTKYEGYNPNKPETLLGMTIMQEEFLENSIALAGKIQDRFVQELGKKSRGGGVKQAPYMVLHKAYMPRVLIETGFISNPVEGERLDSEEGQQDIAEAIAKAIVSYKKDYFDGDGDSDASYKPSDRLDTKISTPTPEKKKSDIDAKKVDNTASEDVQDKKGIVFKIQISASPKKIELEPSNFKGLKNVTCVHTTIYKYMYGNTSSYEEAKKLLQEAKAKGYDSAYILAFKDGKSVDIKDIIK
jgi:N-acetylmuramoyl-L-alanine amidase